MSKIEMAIISTTYLPEINRQVVQPINLQIYPLDFCHQTITAFCMQPILSSQSPLYSCSSVSRIYENSFMCTPVLMYRVREMEACLSISQIQVESEEYVLPIVRYNCSHI